HPALPGTARRGLEWAAARSGEGTATTAGRARRVDGAVRRIRRGRRARACHACPADDRGLPHHQPSDPVPERGDPPHRRRDPREYHARPRVGAALGPRGQPPPRSGDRHRLRRRLDPLESGDERALRPRRPDRRGRGRGGRPRQGCRAVVIRVYSAQNTLMVDHLRHVLEADGIACVVRNRYLSSALGRLPAAECWTELWIRDDARLARAQGIVERALEQDDSAGAATWECPQCGERLEPQFEACWKCSIRRGAAVVEATYGEAPPLRDATKRPPALSPSAQP